jgi:HEPN domain-containing protein
MSTQKQERIFKKEYSKELLKIANGDFGSAVILYENFSNASGRAENVFFMCQQSIEKSLKAVLCALGLPVPMVHELGVLVGKIPASADLEFGYELASLSEFASFRRYQEGVLILSLEEAQDVVAKTESILLWAEKIVFGQA